MSGHPGKPPLGSAISETTAVPNSADRLVLERAEALYRSGQNLELITSVGNLAKECSQTESLVRLAVLQGMALFDIGDVVSSLRVLDDAKERSKPLTSALRFS